MSRGESEDRSTAAQTRRRQMQAGQASFLLLIMLSLFLLAALGFAVDMSNLWFHHQQAQAAANAACQAGAMDALLVAGGGSAPKMGFTLGSAGDCSSFPSATMCSYARFNGYTGGGLRTNAISSSVAWTFPASVSGVTAPDPSVTAYPFLRVTVAETVRTWFMTMVGVAYQPVSASCTCGLATVRGTPPMVILSPTASGALSYSGGATTSIYSGPQRSIQVNSASTTAIAWQGTNAALDTSHAGPNGTGGDVAMVGGPLTQPATNNFNAGTAGKWRTGVVPVLDPYAPVPAPVQPAAATSPRWVAYGTDGCPDHSGSSGKAGFDCLEYFPGYYASGIDLTNVTLNGVGPSKSTVIFAPGIYYLGGSLTVASHTTLRNASLGALPTPDGVMFYFTSGGVSISGGSGAPSTGIDSVSSVNLGCKENQPAPAGVPSTLDGNVLWAQCTAAGTYAGTGSTDHETATGTRSLLLFGAHGNSSSLAFSGQGSLSFIGVLYFHNTSYTAQPNLSGQSGSSTVVSGEIVADMLTLGGGGSIIMSLSPTTTTGVTKVSMF